jgi:hypothetical protein
LNEVTKKEENRIEHTVLEYAEETKLKNQEEILDKVFIFLGIIQSFIGSIIWGYGDLIGSIIKKLINIIMS